MKIVITGGTGQVGTILARAFHQSGHDVVAIARRSTPSPWRTARWDGASPGPWVDELNNADVVMNLAGRSVNCRYTDANRRAILESRTMSTRAVGEGLVSVGHPPRLWLQASTATIYAHRYDAANDEESGIPGGAEPGAPDTWRFSIDVANAWERAASDISTPRTRKVLMRSAMIMSPDHGGVFATLLNLVRLGLGGRSGNGHQFVSWMHDVDFVNAVLWLIDHEEMEGIVNIASPNPVPNRAFMASFRRAWGIPFGLPATTLMVEAGAFLLRSESELILKSRRVVPTRLLRSGFTFQFPLWEDAVQDLCRRWRSSRSL